MTHHPSFERLRNFATGEPDLGRSRIASHLQDCTECRHTITRVREVIAVVRDELAPPAPPGVFERILERRAAGERLILPTDEVPAISTPHPRTLLRRGMPWIVGLLLGAAGTAAAFPGSPVRKWLVQRWRATRAETAIVAPAPSAPIVRDTAVSGVTVPLTAGELWVSVEPDSQSVVIRLRLTDGRELEVRGIGDAARALFRPREGGIGVSNLGAGELQLDVPRAAQRFVLRVRGVPYVVKDGSRLQVRAPSADTIGAELVFRTKP